MMISETHAPITFTVPVWITSREPDFGWLRDRLAGVGWDGRQVREIKGPIAISMRIATPVPPAGLSKRKAALLEAGKTVWRETGLPGTTIADIMIAAMRLRPGQVVQLHIEKAFTPGRAGHIDIMVEVLA
jgi:hypothetical protein